MNIYKLTRPAKYDEARGFVVIAMDELQARAGCHAYGGDEVLDADHDVLPIEQTPWATCPCTLIGRAPHGTAPSIVMRDFNAG